MDAGDNTPGLPSDWPCGEEGDLITPSSSLSSMVDSYVASVWENPTDESHHLGFNLINAHSGVGWQEPNSLLKGGRLLMDSFAMTQSISPYDQLVTPMSNGEPQKNEININPSSASMDGSLSSDHRQQDTRCIDETKIAKSDESDSGGPSLLDAKKRKRGSKDAELEQSQQISGGDPKEEYIHVRARRGQATNSHSLAERVRREKIRERMKFLQDLVPGCSKVTGKAVMLDEIINYVQSLQRQVEFLSMKLATVDPRMDLNIDSLLAKERMFATRAGPSSLGLSLDMRMAYPFMNPSQPNLPVIGGSLRNLDSQLTSLNEGYKETTPQMRNAWDDELQTMVQMGFNPSAPPDNQETPQNSSLPAAHMKAEL